MAASQRVKFTKLEDVRLRHIVSSMAKPDWKLVGTLMGNRTARQCRERYNNYLAPTVSNTPWTKEEEQILLEKYEEMGPQWSKMTQFFEKRAAVSIKNHFAKMMLQKKRQEATEEAEVAYLDGDGEAEAPVVPTAPAEKQVDVVRKAEEPKPKEPEPKRDGVMEAVTKIFRDADNMGDAWYNAESETKFASVVHLPTVE